VGVLISINRDRGDAATLPQDRLDLCEVEILTLDTESNNSEWMKDDTESRIYPR